MTLYRCARTPGSSMPGDPMGIPATASPRTPFGRLASTRRMSAIGTCPSKAIPSTIAVWHDTRFAGRPTFRWNAVRFASSTIRTFLPKVCRTRAAHCSQHPHPGSRCIRMSPAASAGVENNASTRTSFRMCDLLIRGWPLNRPGVN